MAQEAPSGAEKRDADQDMAPGAAVELTQDLAYKRLRIANVVFYGKRGAGDREWTLIDAGIPGSADSICAAAEERFGKSARPAAIIMTHAHFDHIGALRELAEHWAAPVYAHARELPYLNGSRAYPPPDADAGGGLMSAVSRYFSPEPTDVGSWLKALPEDGSVPSMEGWIFLETPGHSPGHISLWRESDSALIVGDAFMTTRQEFAYSDAPQPAEIHGPPMYYTPDWREARLSLERLTALDPEIVVSGHGTAMRGPEMRAALHMLASDFDEIAVPEGRYAAA